MRNDRDQRPAADDALVAEIVGRYDLDDRPTPWQDLGGSWTTNLRLQLHRGPLVARIHPRSTPVDRVRALQDTRRAVAAAGLPAVPPLATPSGRTVLRLSTGNPAEVERFAPWSLGMKSPALLRTGFRILGRLHDVLRDAVLPRSAHSVDRANHVHREQAAELTRQGAVRMRRWQDAPLADFADQVVAHVDAVSAAEVPIPVGRRQLVHGDFWDNNVGFIDGELTALFDFGFQADRDRIDDLALPIWFWLLEPGRGLPTPDDHHLVRELADCYDAGTVAPLSRTERMALPLAIARQPAWSVGRWVRELPEAEARDHARAAAAELPVARAVLDQLTEWRAALLD